MKKNQTAKNLYNINSINTAHFHHYGDKKIKHLLTEPPFIPELFLGRDADLQHIHNRLFAPKGNLLLLVNGEGGIGKSSLGSQYLHTYHQEYTHVAWVFSERSIATALLQLAIPLDLQFDERADTLQRLQILIQAMFELKKPCLLIIDNANELQDLRQYLPHLQRCSNFHILFTTRISDFPQLASYKIEPLSQDQALQVFKAHYPAFEPQEEVLFYEIYAAVQGNTLLLELLAKNLRNFNTKLKKNYLLADLRRDLELGLLQLSKTSAVDVRYQAQGTGLRHEKIEVIIAAMYDLGGLSPAEIQVLSIFAVLPAESIHFERLEALSLGLDGLDFTLRMLAQKGWLDYNEAAVAFKCSPAVQEVVRLKNENLPADCQRLILGLIEKLKYEGDIGYLANTTYAEAVIWARWATVLVNLPWQAYASIGTLCECLGYYHKTTGNLAQALTFFEQQHRLCHESCIAHPNNIPLKNGLAISYSKLGEIHTVLGNVETALAFFERFNQLEKELHVAFPDNASFKEGLAISYAKLGDVFHSLINLNQALTFFKQYKDLKEELSQSHPENVKYKEGLAISYAKLGGIFDSLGNLNQALTFFEKQNKLNEELFVTDPENVLFKNNLAISYSKLGSANSDLGDLKTALTFFKQSNDLVKELSDSYPENVELKNRLAISCQNLGETHRNLRNLQQALTFFKQYNLLEKELYESNPLNVSFKSSLAISYEKLGETHLKLGNLQQALTFFKRYNTLAKELHDAFPPNVEFKHSLGWSYQFLGIVNRSLGNLKLALKFFEDMAHTFAELYNSYPVNVDFKNGLAISYQLLGNTHNDLNNLLQALTFLKQFNSLLKELNMSCPDNTPFKNGLAISYLSLGEFLEQKMQNPKVAQEHYRVSKALLEELAANFPDYVEFQQNLHWIKAKLKD